MATSSNENPLRRIIVHNHKGGTGKTMFAVHLAEYLVEQGQGWHLLDADPQYNAISWLTAHAWEGEDALQLPGDGRREEMIVTIDPETVTGRPNLVVDTPPAGDALQQLGRDGIELGSDDLLVCPVSGRFGIDGAIKVAEEARRTGCRIVAVLNMTDPDDEHAAEEIHAVRELEGVDDLGIEVFKMAIPRNDEYLREAELKGKPVWEIPYARSTHSVRALRAFCRWVSQGAPPEANRMGELVSGEKSKSGGQARVNELQDRLWE
jgi:cellulose biosynthesis protein BcsQ